MKPSAKKAIEILDNIQEKLGPGYVAYLAAPNVILTLSGARGYCDGVFWDYKNKDNLEKWHRAISKSLEVIKDTGQVLWSDVSIHEPRPKQKYAGFDLLLEPGLKYSLEKSQLLKKVNFEEMLGDPSMNGVIGYVVKNLKSQPKFKKMDREKLHHLALGLLLGYPDSAITSYLDSIDDAAGYFDKVIHADIKMADYYMCPQPVYSYPKSKTKNKGIQEHQALWSKILTDYYSSDFHKSLEANKTFVGKLKELDLVPAMREVNAGINSGKK